MAQSRQLAAIMFTDIVGYTALMGEDEQKAFELLKRNRQIQKPLIEKFNGRWLKEIGDGVLASFNTVSDAVYCAKTIQKACINEPDLKLRIGIHEGEVVFEGVDVFGDGVNIASRLETLAPIGGILVSESVHKNILNKKEITTILVGERELRGVREPVRIYQVDVEGVEISEPKTSPSIASSNQVEHAGKKPPNKRKVIWGVAAIILMGLGYMFSVNTSGSETENISEMEIVEKSIAVLPFVSLSTDPEKQYLADGVMDAILLHLSKIENLRVITRTSVERYRNTTMTIPEIASELNVHHVLEGSFQKYGDKANLIVQLSNAQQNEDHLWANEYNRDWSDIFTVQSEVSQTIARELKAVITPEEKQLIEKIPTANLKAYDFYLKGESYLFRSLQVEDFRFAIRMFERAVEIDEKFTLAWVGLASASRNIYWYNYGNSEKQLAQIKQYLDRAMALDPDLKEVQLEAGWYYYQCKLNYPKALQIFEKLKSKHPNDYELSASIGFVYRRMGQFEMFLELMDRTILLNPSYWQVWFAAGETLTILGRYTEAENYLKTAIDLNPSAANIYILLARLHLATGNVDKARVLMETNQNVDGPVMYMTRSNIELIDRNYQEAISILESSPHDEFVSHKFYIPKSMQLGFIYYVMGEREIANIHFHQAREILEDKLNDLQDDSRLHSSLGLVYAGLGMATEAKAAGNRALEIMDSSVDALKGLYREVDMVRILMMISEYDEAVEKLEIQLQKMATFPLSC